MSKDKIPGLDATGLFGEKSEPVSDDEKHNQLVNLLTEIASISKDILANIKGEAEPESK